MNFILPAELRDALLAYMLERPYGEVWKGVQALESLKPLPEPEESSEADGA